MVVVVEAALVVSGGGGGRVKTQQKGEGVLGTRREGEG